MQLGNIEILNPKNLGIHEEHQFTPWLLENLDRLGETLGIDIDPEGREREIYVGRYIVDIMAREASTGRKIIIENQLLPSNHGHLGQLMTYAAGAEGSIIVWVCHELRDEHRRVLDWLNAQIKGVAFFGVEFEVIKIDNSNPAFRFVSVVRPPAWEEEVIGSGDGKPERYRSFYQPLMDELREKHKFTNARKAQEQSWYLFKTGFTGVFYNTGFTSSGHLRVGLYMQGPNPAVNKAIFDIISQQRDEITQKMGFELVWERGDGRQYCRISVSTPGVIDDVDGYPQLQAWAVEKLLKFKAVFGPLLPDIVAEARAMAEEANGEVL